MTRRKRWRSSFAVITCSQQKLKIAYQYVDFIFFIDISVSLFIFSLVTEYLCPVSAWDQNSLTMKCSCIVWISGFEGVVLMDAKLLNSLYYLFNQFIINILPTACFLTKLQINLFHQKASL